MKVSTEMIKDLRQATGAGVLDVKNALEANDGDYEMALVELRKKGVAQAEKRGDRQTKEGVVEVYSHPGSRVGVMLELNSESDFVALNERFKTLAHDLVLHVAAMQPLYVNPEDIPSEELDQKKNEFQEKALAEGKPPEIVDKIIAGRLNKFYEEVCLMEQPFVKDDNIKVKELITDVIGVMGEKIVVRRFVRYELGE